MHENKQIGIKEIKMATLNTLKNAIFLANGGTLPVPTAGFIESTEPVIVNPEHTPIEQKRSVGQLGSTEVCKDPNYVKTAFDIPHQMRTSNLAQDALDTLPNYDLLLKASGMEVAITGGVGSELITYKNTQTPTNTSAVHYSDGFKQTMTGSLVANTTIELNIGEPATMNTSFQGFIDNAGVATAEATPTVTLSDEVCLVVSSVDVLTAGGLTVPFDTCSIDFGAEIEEYYTTGGVNGLKEFSLNDYVQKITLSYFEDSTNFIAAQQAVADQNEVVLIAKLGTDPTSGALVNGKSIRITAPRAKYMDLSDSADKQKTKRELVFLCQSDATQTNLTIEAGFFA